MNILLTGFSFTTLGGLEIVSAAIAQSLAESGHHVRCAAIHGHGVTDAGTYLVEGLLPAQRIFRSILHRSGLSNSAPGRLREMVAWADAIIACHCHTLPLVFKAAQGAAGTAPVVAWLHGREVWGGMGRDFAASLRQADRLVAVSHYTSETVTQLLGDAFRPLVIHNPIDTESFQPVATPAAIDRNTVLTVGRHDADTQHKGYDTLVEATGLLRKRSPGLPLRLRVAGDGTRLQALKESAARHGVADRVDFLGAVSKSRLRELYAGSDLFAFPSRVVHDGDDVYGEGFGVVNIEAAACGRPIVTSTHGGCPETIRHGVTGLVVNPDSVAAVADGIERLLLLDPKERDAMGARGRQFVLDHFSNAILSRKLADLLDSLPSRGRRSS